MFISDNESFNPALWEEQRKQRAQVAFECDEDKDEREAPPRVSLLAFLSGVLAKFGTVYLCYILYTMLYTVYLCYTTCSYREVLAPLLTLKALTNPNYFATKKLRSI